jgi:glycosyltransferase involved in cell wall biosynthesis
MFEWFGYCPSHSNISFKPDFSIQVFLLSTSMSIKNRQNQDSNPPSISIIMTVFNRAQYLETAIESVLSQTYSNFELLIWDDGSTDRSIEIAEHYAEHDSRIRFIAAEHQGRALALKNAHNSAIGTYVGWLDSDDRLAPTALAATAEILDANPEIGMVYTQYQTIDADDRLGGLGKRCHIRYSDIQILVDFMTFHFRLIRRSLYEQVGGVDVSFPCAMDYDLCLKLSEVTQICALEQPLYFYRDHSESISQRQYTQQLHHSQRAVRNALERRGLSNDYELVVQPSNCFELHLKAHAPTIA